MAQSGNLGNESTGTLIADASATAARLAPFEPRKIINQDHQPRSKHASGYVAKQRGHQAWFARTKIEVQNSTCVELKKKQEFA
jgi:hypothetical protein